MMLNFVRVYLHKMIDVRTEVDLLPPLKQNGSGEFVNRRSNSVLNLLSTCERNNGHL